MFGGFTQTKIEVHINLISENAVNLLLCYIIAIPTKNKKKKKRGEILQIIVLAAAEKLLHKCRDPIPKRI